MRRFFVIFLILLFPLNVFALSMSASLAQQGEPVALSIDAGKLAETPGGEARGDVDPDEPPSTADLHDILHHEAPPRAASQAAGPLPPHQAARYSHSLPPPLKPPCAA